MTLVKNWDEVLKKAWSARLMYLLVALNGLYSAWPAFQDVLPLWMFALGSMLLAGATVGLRVVEQGLTKNDQASKT